MSSPRNWTDMAVEKGRDAQKLRYRAQECEARTRFTAGQSRQDAVENLREARELRLAADESGRAAHLCAEQARAGVPWPGETIATLVLIDVMAEVEPVEAGRCC